MPPQTYRECNDLLRTMLRRRAKQAARSPPSWVGAGGVCSSTLVVFLLVTFMSLLALTGFASFLALAHGGGVVAWWGTPVTAAAAAAGGGGVGVVNITENLSGGEEEGRGGRAVGADDRSTVHRTAAVSVDDLTITTPGVSNYLARVTLHVPGRATDREWTETTPQKNTTRRIPVPVVPVVSEGNVTRKNNDRMSMMSDRTWKGMMMMGGRMPHDRPRRRRRMRRTTRRGLQGDDGRSRTIQTTLDSNGKSFGSMFVLHNNNPDGNDLSIETLSVHVDLEPPTSTRVEVYARPDSYVGYEDGPSGWTVVCNATVRSMGEGQVTFVPPEEFDTVTISWGGAHAFYVTLPTENLLHTSFEEGEGMGSGSVYASNDDVSILTGTAVWDHSFGPSTADDPAVFNGEVRYSLVPAAARSGSTPPPTASPPPLGYKSVPERCTTTFDENNGAYGAYFTVVAKRRIRVTSIDFHTDKTHDLQVNVYTREGDYRGHEYDRDAWTIVASTTVTGAGSGRPTSISARGSRGGGGGGGRPPLIDDGGDSDATKTGNFLPVDVMEGRSQSFFVTLSTEDLRYSNTDEPIGSTIVSTSAIYVLVGTGSSGYPVGYPPFDPSNRLFNSRMFNGVVHYLTAVSEDYPSIYPYPSTLITTLEGGTRGFGAMFDVVANVPTGAKVLITGIDFHTDLDRDMPTTSVEVYTKLGSYAGFEDDPSAWTRIAEVDGVTGLGPGVATPIVGGGGSPSGVGVVGVGGDGGGVVVRPGSSSTGGVVGGDLGEGRRPTTTVTMQDRSSAGGTTVISPFFDPVTVDSDHTRSFYVTLPTTNMSYTTLDPSLLRSDFTSDLNLRVLVGVGVAYPFGGGVGRTYSPRMFNGAVHYAVADPPPTAAPSSMPSTSSPTPQPTFAPAAEPATPLVTQQKIQIAGVSARRLLQGARIVGGGSGGRRRRLELAEESVGFFENVTQQFLADEARKSGVNVQKATVATELDLDDVEGLEEDDEGDGATDDADGDGDGGGSNSSAPVLDLYTTIEGEYRPPPYVDFGVLVEDTFEEKGDVFVEELKEDPTGFFEEATGVETAQVSFPLPAPPEPPVERSNAKLIAAVSGGCGGVFLLVVAVVIVLFVLKRRRRKKAAASAEDYSECKSFDDFEEDELGYGDDKSGKSGGGGSVGRSEPGVYRSSSLEPIRKAGSGDEDDHTDDGGKRSPGGRGKLRRRNSQERILRRRSSSSSLEPIMEESSDSIRTQ